MALDHSHCYNCGLFHAQPPSTSTSPSQSSSSPSPNCFFLTIRQSGRHPIPLLSTSSADLRILHLPHSATDRRRLRDWLWKQFQDIKEDNEVLRHALLAKSGRSISKGELKTKQPLPWLSWRAPGLEKGQTRNEGNFWAVWEEYVERPCRSAGGDGDRVLWLSSTLLEVDEADGFDGKAKAEDCGSVGVDSGYESCHEES